MMNEEIINVILPFLEKIGIPFQFTELAGDCFLPGLSIENGIVLIDKDRLKHPGDILHEAAHIAVVPGNERSTLNANEIAARKDNAAEEMMAIAWSYAAAVYLSIDPRIIFHNDGYQGDGDGIADNFTAGRYFGVPMLQWAGMCIEPDKKNKTSVNTYPYLLSWLRK
jgi:hypothetical protein